MPRIPLEDNFDDVIRKAQRHAGLTDSALAEKAQLTMAQVQALKTGTFDEKAVRAIAPVLKLGANALVDLGRKAWYPEQPLFSRGFAIFNTNFEDMAVNSYLIWDPRTKRAVAFDTGGTVSPMLDTIAAENLKLDSIFLTHTHDDHIADLDTLVKATHAPVFASELETIPSAKTFKEGATFHVDGLTIKTLSTWGHSPGGTSYVIGGLPQPLAIVGDSLFASSMGGGMVSPTEAYRNNVEKILTLSNGTVLASGHGPLTTVGQEKKHNPFFTR
ncbi:MAG TPA: MBL fold metallo-hydrolase [Opitutaceae bacterium]|nr:MBL fold metallo-hydrolase [Opitutaceae bacterium]